MPLAADEVLLYPRRRRYIIVWGTGLPVPFAEVRSAQKHIVVGNGFIRSAYTGFVSCSRSGNRKNRIGTGVKALLKKRL